jgi:hypothetical protein
MQGRILGDKLRHNGPASHCLASCGENREQEDDKACPKGGLVHVYLMFSGLPVDNILQ